METNGTGSNLKNATIACFLEITNVYSKDLSSLYVSSVLLCLLTLPAILIDSVGNGLVIVAIIKNQQLQSPSKVLLCSLAVTDLLTWVFGAPTGIVALAARTMERYHCYCIAYGVSLVGGYFLTGVSFFTLTAVTVDRFLAINLHMRYHEFVTIPRTVIVQTGNVVGMTLLMGLSWLTHYDKRFGCIIASLLLTGLILNSLAFVSILRTVHKHEVLINSRNVLSAHYHGEGVSNKLAMKKSTYTMASIVVIFFLCYCPHLLVEFAVFVGRSKIMPPNLRIAHEWTAFLCALNGVLNPFVYCLRMSEMRQAVTKLFRKTSTVEPLFLR